MTNTYVETLNRLRQHRPTQVRCWLEIPLGRNGQQVFVRLRRPGMARFEGKYVAGLLRLLLCVTHANCLQWLFKIRPIEHEGVGATSPDLQHRLMQCTSCGLTTGWGTCGVAGPEKCMHLNHDAASNRRRANGSCKLLARVKVWGVSLQGAMATAIRCESVRVQVQIIEVRAPIKIVHDQIGGSWS